MDIIETYTRWTNQTTLSPTTNTTGKNTNYSAGLIENGFPTELIVEKDIFFEIKDEFKGWFYLDLKPYDILLEKQRENIAITIQWVESKKANKKSKYFSISTAMSITETSFFREKAMDKWTKSGQGLSFYLNAICR